MADSECLKIFLESDEIKMQTYTYVSKGKFELMEKPKPVLIDDRDAIVKVTLASICSSDLHIKHGSVPRAVPLYSSAASDVYKRQGLLAAA